MKNMFLKICALSLITFVAFLFSCSNSNIEDKINNNVVNTEKEVKDTIEYMIATCDGKKNDIGNSRDKQIYLDSFEVSYSNFMNFCEPSDCCKLFQNSSIDSSRISLLSILLDMRISILLISKDDIVYPFTPELKDYYMKTFGISAITDLEYKKVGDLKFNEFNARIKKDDREENGFKKNIDIDYNEEYYFSIVFESLSRFCFDDSTEIIETRERFDNLCYCFLENLEINLIES